MIRRKIGSIILAICLCFHFISFGAQAAATTDAIEPIIMENTCSLTVSYRYGETGFSDMQVKLYRIAEVSADFQYTLTQPFAASGLVLNGIQSAGEWDVVRSTLEAYILGCGIAPDAVSVTNGDGQAKFDALSTGMYLAVVGQAIQDDLRCRFDSALVALPGIGQDGRWQYAVSVNAKPGALPPADPEEKIELKVLKLWKGDEGRIDRPKSVEVAIFCDGVLQETVALSEENHWSYTWSAKDDGASWSVAEKNVPQGYTMTVETREASFILTNTRIPTNTDDTPKPPPTGDTVNIVFYALLMAVSGTMLIILGIMRKRMN